MAFEEGEGNVNSELASRNIESIRNELARWDFKGNMLGVKPRTLTMLRLAIQTIKNPSGLFTLNEQNKVGWTIDLASVAEAEALTSPLRLQGKDSYPGAHMDISAYLGLSSEGVWEASLYAKKDRPQLIFFDCSSETSPNDVLKMVLVDPRGNLPGKLRAVFPSAGKIKPIKVWAGTKLIGFKVEEGEETTFYALTTMRVGKERVFMASLLKAPGKV